MVVSRGILCCGGATQFQALRRNYVHYVVLVLFHVKADARRPRLAFPLSLPPPSSPTQVLRTYDELFSSNRVYLARLSQ